MRSRLSLQLPLAAPLTVCLLLLFVGCTDVRGEASGAPYLTVDVQGAQWAALQDGTGPWRVLDLRAALPYTPTLPVTQGGVPAVLPVAARAATPPLPVTAPSLGLQVALTDPKGRYGVASVCPDAAGNLLVRVQQATLAESAQVFSGCAQLQPTSGEVGTVSGDVSGLRRGEYGSVYLGARSTLVDSAAPQHLLVLPALQGERLDLIAARYRGGALVPERLVFEPDLQLAAGDRLEVDFTGPSSFAPETGSLKVEGTAEGEVVSAVVDIVSVGGTRARLGELSRGSTLTYARPPAARIPGGTLHASVQSFSYDSASRSGSSRGLEATFRPPPIPETAPETPLTLRLPDALGPVDLALQGPPEALRPTASWPAHEAGAGSYTQFYSQIRDGRTLSYALHQSGPWSTLQRTLGGAQHGAQPGEGQMNRMSYTLPDFSALAAWDPTWSLGAEADIFWNVSFEGAPEGAGLPTGTFQSVSAGRSGVLTP